MNEPLLPRRLLLSLRAGSKTRNVFAGLLGHFLYDHRALGEQGFQLPLLSPGGIAVRDFFAQVRDL